MTPYTALIARAMLIGRLDVELKHSKPGYFREKLIEQRDMARALLLEGMHDRSIRTPFPKLVNEYVQAAWTEVMEAMEDDRE